MEYLTITAMSQQLGIPDSTVRYYVKNHSEYLPAKGESRKKRYSPECIEVLRFIAEGYRNRKTATDINDELSGRYARVIEHGELSQRNTTTTQQLENTALSAALLDISRSLSIIADQQAQIEELKARLDQLEQTTTRPQQGFWGRFLKR